MSDSTRQLPTVIDAVEKRLPDIQKMLPKTISVDEFFSQFKLAAMRVEGLLQCTPRSVMIACMQAAADGLLVDGREAAIVVHNVKQKDNTWRKEAVYWQMYQGQLKRVRMTENVARIESRMVYHADKFAISYGDAPSITHTPAVGRDRGDVIGCYAIVTYKDGTKQHEFMELEELEAIRNRSRGYNPEKPGGPWKSDFAEMCKKTVLRRLAKLLPQSSGHKADQVDADDVESAADAIDMLDFDRQLPPPQPEQQTVPQAAPEQPTSRIPTAIPEAWHERLGQLETDVRAALDRESVETAWSEWDAAYGDQSPPKAVLSAVKEIVDARLAQIKAAAESYEKAQAGS